MTITYLGLDDFLAIALEVTGWTLDTILDATNLDLADSALHAPRAGFGDVEFYPDFIDKAAVLVVHLARNHPLPDGNKRSAWVALRLFLTLNGWSWEPTPTDDEAELFMLGIASGTLDVPAAAAWLRKHLSTQAPR